VTQRIRDAFERRASPYAGERGITIPMSFKIAVGRQPQSSDSES
jgi:hypothetical protein